jgi:hypothetical protein
MDQYQLFLQNVYTNLAESLENLYKYWCGKVVESQLNILIYSCIIIF